MKTTYTWRCPLHGVLHTITSDADSTTDSNAAAIAVTATQGLYANGCPEPIRTSRGPRECGEQVLKFATEAP